MKKILITISISMLLLLSACSQSTSDISSLQVDTKEDNLVESIIYKSEHGDIEVPADPQRIVILDSTSAGALILFDSSIVGHEKWTASNELFTDYLKDSTEVSLDNLEQILALDPDLIVTSANNENFDELSKIAPTVSFSYGKLNYLDTIIEYGKLVNKEEKAKEWVENYKNEAKKIAEGIKEKYGEDVSISVIEAFGDEIYLFGDNWGRGTQVVYQEMGLSMPESVKEVALTDGYYSISSEVIAQYAADLMIFTYFDSSNMAFTETETWKNIDAIKNNNVLKVPAESFYMTGPITLTHQLGKIKEFFLE